MTIIYRTAGPWGAATSSGPLTEAQADTNFWTLFEAIAAIGPVPAGIDYFEVIGDNFSVVLTDHTVLGPYALPIPIVNTIHSGAGAPLTSPEIGISGDYYIDTSALVIYGPKTGGGWGVGVSLVGAAGEAGPLGYSGRDGDDGEDSWPIPGAPGPPGPAGTTIQNTIQTVTQSGAALAIDRSLGEICELSLTANITGVTVTGWPAAGFFGRIILDVFNTGAFGITGWVTGMTWSGSAAPTITSGSGKHDRIMISTKDGGISIQGDTIGQNYG